MADIVARTRRSLKEADPEMYALCQREARRQCRGLELIASEVRPLLATASAQALAASPC